MMNRATIVVTLGLRISILIGVGEILLERFHEPLGKLNIPDHSREQHESHHDKRDEQDVFDRRLPGRIAQSFHHSHPHFSKGWSVATQIAAIAKGIPKGIVNLRSTFGG